MNLPKELYQEISGHLFGVDLINFLLVIRFDSDKFWKMRSEKDYPNTCVIDYNPKQNYIRSYYLYNFGKITSYLSKCTLYKIVSSKKSYRVIRRMRNKQIIVAVIGKDGKFIIREGEEDQKRIKCGTIVSKYFGLEFIDKKGKLSFNNGLKESEIKKILNEI